MTFLQKLIQKQKVFNHVVLASQYLLHTSPHAKEARRYISETRKISEDAQQFWKFGYFPSDERISELTALVSKQDLTELNLYYPKYIAGGTAPHGHFSDHNLIMPFHDVHGNIIAILGRCLLTEEERSNQLLNKYKYTHGCQKDLFVYGLNRAKQAILDADCVICVEGQMDCIALHEHGIKNVIALGWANMSRYQFWQIRRYTKNIVLMLDSDEAGKKAKIRLKNRYKDFANIKLAAIPDGFKDMDEFFREATDKPFVNFVIDTIKQFG